MVYYNAYITGEYNALIYPNQPGFFSLLRWWLPRETSNLPVCGSEPCWKYNSILPLVPWLVQHCFFSSSLRIMKDPPTGVIILPTQTMHCYKGNPFKITRKIVWFDSPQMGNLMTPVQKRGIVWLCFLWEDSGIGCPNCHQWQLKSWLILMFDSVLESLTNTPKDHVRKE